ncbi:hypothetical protein Tco_0032769 [Tanacetum coccineum]
MLLSDSLNAVSWVNHPDERQLRLLHHFHEIDVFLSVFLKEVVHDGWETDVSGFWMFKVVKRLKVLKKPLHKLLYDQGNLHENVKHLRLELDEAQKALDSDSFNATICEDEVIYLQAFNDALLTEERFLKQKAKIEWLNLGDSNTTYFHKVVKSHALRNRIDYVTTTSGTLLMAIKSRWHSLIII